MTAAAGEIRRDSMAEHVSRLPLPSFQSLVTLALVALMSITVAWSIDDAAWVLGDPTYGDFLVYPAILATLVGFVGAQAHWPRWLTHFLGACAAALVVPLFVGAILVPGASLGDMYRATAASMVNAWYDLAILNLAVTREIGHYLLVLGLLVWSVGQFASYAVFGHRRPLDAVIVVGMMLLGNMALTVRDQLPLLVLFSIAALCVLARSHALDEEAAWLRRRIGDASSVRSLYLRGGSVFIGAAVIGSLLLTGSASSAPLAGAWTGFGDKLIEISQSLQRYLPFGGAPRPVGFGFGQTAPISGSWSQNNELAVTIHVPPGDKTLYYWRAVAYDRFEGQAWAWTDSRGIDQAGGAPALLGQADNPDGLGLRTKVEFTVTPASGRNPYVVSPPDASSVDQASTLFVVGTDGYFSALGSRSPPDRTRSRRSSPSTRTRPGDGRRTACAPRASPTRPRSRRSTRRCPTARWAPRRPSCWPISWPRPARRTRTTWRRRWSRSSRRSATTRTSSANVRPARAWSSASPRSRRATASTTPAR